MLFRHPEFLTFFPKTNMVPEQKIDLSDIFVVGLRECLKVTTQQWS